MTDHDDACPHCGGTGRLHTKLFERSLIEVATAEDANVSPREGHVYGAVLGSATIYKACLRASEIAKSRSRPVVFEFSGTEIVVAPGDNPNEVAFHWLSKGSQR